MAEENKEEELELTEITEETTEDKSSDNTSSNENPSADNNENQEDDTLENQDFAKKKKSNKLKLVLFGVIGLLATLLVIGLILFFTGFFDPEPIEEPMQKENTTIMSEPEIKKEKFSLQDVNTNNLNKELLKLTNKSIIEKREQEKLDKQKEELEEEKKKYQEKLALEEKKLAEEKKLLDSKQSQLEKQKSELEDLKMQANSLKEELLREKEILEVEREKLILAQLEIENTIKQEENKQEIQKEKNKQEELALKEQVKQMQENHSNIKNIQSNDNNKSMIETENQNMNQSNIEDSQFVQLINVAKIKGELYKDYLDKTLSVHRDVLLCRDDFNNIEIYFGPFDDMNERKNVYNKLIENDFENSYEVELTNEEFNKRCKY